MSNVRKDINPERINGDILTYRAITTETATIETYLKITCPTCQTINHIPVTKVNIPHTIKNKNVTLYQPGTTHKCPNCNNTIAHPQKLIKPNQQPTTEE